MYTNKNLEIITDNSPYTDKKGVKYPAKFPKSEIGELYPVETVQPEDGRNYSGFKIEKIKGKYIQVWEYIEEQEQTEEEIWFNIYYDLLNQIPDALETVIDILPNKNELPEEVLNTYNMKKTHKQIGKNKGYI